MDFASLGLWSTYLRPKDVYHASHEHHLRITNISLVPEPPNVSPCSTVRVSFLCDGLLAGIGVLTPENCQTPVDLPFPKGVMISIKVNGLIPVSVSGIFVRSSGPATHENVSSPIPLHTRSNSNDPPRIPPARDSLNGMRSDRDIGTEGKGAVSTVGQAFMSASHETLVEDLESGSGYEVQTRSTVSFRTKMWDSAGGIVDRFSFEALTCSYRDCARILPGLSEGLEGMRAGGCRRVHLPPSAPARTEWGDEGMEELQEETLVLEITLHKVELSKAD